MGSGGGWSEPNPISRVEIPEALNGLVGSSDVKISKPRSGRERGPKIPPYLIASASEKLSKLPDPGFPCSLTGGESGNANKGTFRMAVKEKNMRRQNRFRIFSFMVPPLFRANENFSKKTLFTPKVYISLLTVAS